MSSYIIAYFLLITSISFSIAADSNCPPSSHPIESTQSCLFIEDGSSDVRAIEERQSAAVRRCADLTLGKKRWRLPWPDSNEKNRAMARILRENVAEIEQDSTTDRFFVWIGIRRRQKLVATKSSDERNWYWLHSNRTVKLEQKGMFFWYPKEPIGDGEYCAFGAIDREPKKKSSSDLIRFVSTSCVSTSKNRTILGRHRARIVSACETSLETKKDDGVPFTRQWYFYLVIAVATAIPVTIFALLVWCECRRRRRNRRYKSGESGSKKSDDKSKGKKKKEKLDSTSNRLDSPSKIADPSASTETPKLDAARMNQLAAILYEKKRARWGYTRQTPKTKAKTNTLPPSKTAAAAAVDHAEKSEDMSDIIKHQYDNVGPLPKKKLSTPTTTCPIKTKKSASSVRQLKIADDSSLMYKKMKSRKSQK